MKRGMKRWREDLYPFINKKPLEDKGMVTLGGMEASIKNH
jgi:hypothetical protein